MLRTLVISFLNNLSEGCFAKTTSVRLSFEMDCVDVSLEAPSVGETRVAMVTYKLFYLNVENLYVAIETVRRCIATTTIVTFVSLI